MVAKSFRVEAVLPAPAHTYFLERDSAAFRSLLSKVLKIGQLEFNDLWHEGPSSFVRMVTKPEFGSWVPKSVAGQLQSSNLEFHDIIEYNPAHIASPPYQIFVRTESPFLKDKLDIQLTLTIEEVEPGVSCRQILEGNLRVKMFGVGRIVEGIVKDSLTNTYKKLPEIVRRWQLFRDDALRRGDGRQLLLGRPPVGCEVGWIRAEVLEVLKEPLSEDGTASPVSALCPVAGASEASEESLAAQARAHQRAVLQQRAAEAEAEAVFAAAAAAAPGQPQQAAAAAEEAAEAAQPSPGAQLDELQRGGRRHSTALSEYFDAREVCTESGGSFTTASAAPAGMLPPTSETEELAAAAAAASPRSLPALAAAVLARGGSGYHHRRTLSSESATSTDTPTTEGGTQRAPGSRRFWRRFNRDYSEWDVYWDQVGVEQEAEGEDGASGALVGGVVGRALHAVEDLMRDSYYSTSILVALFLLRRGWLRVEPDVSVPSHEEAGRHHEGHRHRRTASGGWRLGSAPTHRRTGSGGGVASVAAAGEDAQAVSLARVAQEVCGRMVVGPRRAPTVLGATAPAALSSGARQAGGAAHLPRTRSVDVGADGMPAHAPPATPAPAGKGGPGLGMPRHHRKTMSLDTGTAAAAQEAAAAAVLEQRRRQLLQHRGGTAGAAAGGAGAGLPPLLPSWPQQTQLSSGPLQRRPSDLAAATAMASMQRNDHRVRGPSRLSCFGGCRRPPAVKD